MKIVIIIALVLIGLMILLGSDYDNVSTNEDSMDLE
jgi:hypothetical protein